MRRANKQWIIFFLCLTGVLLIFLMVFQTTAIASDKQISIRKTTDPGELFIDPNIVYNNIEIRIRPYQTLRLGLKLYVEDLADPNQKSIWIYYTPSTDPNLPFQEYPGGPIYLNFPDSLKYKEWQVIDWDLRLDLNLIESMLETILKLKAIQEIELVGNRYDLAYIYVFRLLNDGTRSTIVIDDFEQDPETQGWKSSYMKYYTIAYESNMHGYLKAEYPSATTDDSEDDQSTQYPYYYYGYGYPSGSSYYGSSLYGGYYGGGYYGGGYYGGGYYGGGYYGGGYYGGYYGGLYGGGYYGGSYYSPGYYGSGLYGMGYYGGLYGGGLYGSYGGLYGGLGGLYGGLMGLYGGLFGLRNYYGGPIGLGLGGLLGAFV